MHDNVDDDGDKDDDDDDEDDSAPSKVAPPLDASFKAELDRIIRDEFDGECFVKLNWSCPRVSEQRDALFVDASL